MAAILAWGLLCIVLVHTLYRRWTRRASLTNLPGPEPESFLLGDCCLHLLASAYFINGVLILGNLRQFYQGQAGEVRTASANEWP